MSDLEFRITTSAELSGAKSVQADLERQIGRAKMLGTNYAELEQRLQRVRTAIQNFDGSASFMDKLSAGFHRIGSAIPGFDRVKTVVTELASGPVGAVVAGFTAIGSAITYAGHAVHEFMGAEEIVAKLDASLAQNGNLTKEIRERYQELADTLQDQTTVAGEAWLSVMTRLTQQGVKPEEIEKYTTGVKNLAGVMGGDIEAAANIMTRAMNGNFSVLRRYGIVIDETIPQAQQLDRVFQQLAQRGGGQLEATSRTLAGQFRAVKNELSDIAKGVGNFIAQTGVVQATAEYLKEGFAGWREELSGIIPQLPGLANNTGAAATSMGQAAREAQAFATHLENIAKQGNAAIEAVTKLTRATADYGEAQNRELDRQKQVELAQFRSGAHTRSEAANISGEAQIEAKYATRTSGVSIDSINAQIRMLTEHQERMMEEERELQAQLREAIEKSKTKGGSDALVTEKAGLQKELELKQREFAETIARMLDNLELLAKAEFGDKATSPQAAQIQAAVDKGVPAVVELLRELGKTGKLPIKDSAVEAAELQGQYVANLAKRIEQIGTVESQQKQIGDLTTSLDKLREANAKIYEQIDRSVRELQQRAVDVDRDAQTKNQLTAIETQKKVQEAMRGQTTAQIDAAIKAIENQMYEGMPLEDYRDSRGAGRRGRINLMRDKSELEKRKLDIEQQYGAKSGAEAELIEQQKRAIEKALREAIQKLIEEAPFYNPRPQGYVPGTKGPTLPDVPTVAAPDLGSVDRSIEMIFDTAKAMAGVAKRLNDSVAPFEIAVELIEDHNVRLAAVEESLRNMRPA